MGNRGNIRIHNGNKDRAVYLYAHWAADSVLPAAVAAGLTRGTGRWDDPTYLARIIFCDLIRNDLDGSTGYGIAAHINDVDGADRILDVNCATQTVSYEGDWGDREGEIRSFEGVVSNGTREIGPGRTELPRDVIG